jgi:hypothetical protein
LLADKYSGQKRKKNKTSVSRVAVIVLWQEVLSEKWFTSISGINNSKNLFSALQTIVSLGETMLERLISQDWGTPSDKTPIAAKTFLICTGKKLQ